MIEPKEKASELVDKFIHLTPLKEWNAYAKLCAKIAANEVLEATPMYTGNLNPKWKYWDEVKQEIEKL